MKRFIKTMGRYFLSTLNQDYFTDGIGLETRLDKIKHVFTLSGLKSTGFYQFSDSALRLLTDKYQPSDIEFTVKFKSPGVPINEKLTNEDYEITIVQCRQMTDLVEMSSITVPKDIPEENIFCTVNKNIVNGYTQNIEYIIYVDINKYFELEESQMYTVARIIGKLNSKLKDHRFILIGPGRWGSSSPFQGIKAIYSEIYNTSALIEVSRLLSDDQYSEASLGSHFGNDIRESKIITMSIYPGSDDTIFRQDKLDSSPSLLNELLSKNEKDSWADEVVKVISSKSIIQAGENKNIQYLHIISNSGEQKGMIFADDEKHMRKADTFGYRRPIEKSPNSTFSE